MGFDVHRSTGAMRTVLGAVGGPRIATRALLEVLDGVHEVLRITEPYKLASRTFKRDDTIVDVGDVRIGGDEVIVMAGPCSAETRGADAGDGRLGQAGGRQGAAGRARSSRARRRTPSRASASRDCACFATPRISTV